MNLITVPPPAEDRNLGIARRPSLRAAAKGNERAHRCQLSCQVRVEVLLQRQLVRKDERLYASHTNKMNTHEHILHAHTHPLARTGGRMENII